MDKYKPIVIEELLESLYIIEKEVKMIENEVQRVRNMIQRKQIISVKVKK